MSRSEPLAITLGDFAAGFDLNSEPSRELLLRRVRWHVLDAVGLAYAAWAADDDFAGKLLAGLESEHGSPSIAALINGSLAHGFDFDDHDMLTVMHCEAFATACALAVAERRGLSGRALAEAWVVCGEIALRLAAGPKGAHGLYSAGFHNTAVFGTIGAAAGAAKLLGLDSEQTATAIALAVSFASGTSVGWLTGSGRNKTPQAGWAAHGGTVAASMASAGYPCALSTLDEPRGFFDAHAWRDGWSPEPILDGLGRDWRIARQAIKLFPCGSMIQATAEGTQELVRRERIHAEELHSGELKVPAQFREVIDGMGPSLYRPPSGPASIGSWPCVAARIILEGRYGLEHRTDEAIRDPRMLAVADRLRVVVDEDNLDLPLDQRPATVTVTTSRGIFSHTVSIDAGQYERLTQDLVVAKFRANASLSLSPDQVPRIEAAVLALDEVEDVHQLTDVLEPVPVATGTESE
jgi:2-methylcitrate dehydratase PrpD